MSTAPAAQRLAALLTEEQLDALAEELEAAVQRSGETWVDARIRCRGGYVRDLELSPIRRVKRSGLTRRPE